MTAQAATPKLDLLAFARTVLVTEADAVRAVAGLTARAQAGAVVALDVEIRAAQRLGDSRHEFERRGAMGDANTGEASEFHKYFLVT